MTLDLPRAVTVPVDADAPAHKHLDALLPSFRNRLLGRAWPNVIAGRQDVSGRAYEVHCPFDRDILVARLIAADRRAVRDAVSSARQALGSWAGLGWQGRVRLLRGFADEVARRRDDLALASLYECGKPRAEAVREVEAGIASIRAHCDALESAPDLHKGWRPQGVMAVMTPFSAPVALACDLLAACLASGNSVVLKPAPSAGLSAFLIAEAAAESGVPAGVLSVLCGEEAGQLLVDEEDIDAIALAGSTTTAVKVMRRLAQVPMLRPVIAALGSKNPAFVTASADLDLAADGIVRSAFASQGQSCLALSIVYAERAVYAGLLERLKGRVLAIKTGSPEEARVTMGPVISAAALSRFEAAVRAVRARGRIVTGGDRLQTGRLARGFFAAPTIAADLPLDHPLLRDELLLPLLCVVPVASLAEGLNHHGLQATNGRAAWLYAADSAEIDGFLAGSDGEILAINQATPPAAAGEGPPDLIRFMRVQRVYG